MVILAVVTCAGVALLYAIEKQPFLEILDAAYAKDTAPSVYLIPEKLGHIVPRPLGDTVQHTFVIDGVQVVVPSSLISEVKKSSDDQITVINGPEGRLLVLFPDSGFGKMVQEMQESDSPLFSERELRSSFVFALVTMQSTSVGFSYFTPSELLVRAAILLPLKHGDTNDASAIRPIAIGTLRAIQIGDPDMGDTTVRVFLFPRQYGHVELIFRSYSSEEIAFVLESLVA